jgi:protein SCO1/2
MAALSVLASLAALPADAAAPRTSVASVVPAQLVDARGVAVDFAGGAVADAVVVVNPIWTGCSSLCPLTSAVMGELAERLGGRLGRDVRLISLAIDPIETPRAQLAAWTESYGEVPGWLWLGGPPGAVEAVMAGLGAPIYGAADDHPPVFLVLDGRDGELLRFNGIADAGLLQTAVEQLRDDGR